jgi:hypothetical protein
MNVVSNLGDFENYGLPFSFSVPPCMHGDAAAEFVVGGMR